MPVGHNQVDEQGLPAIARQRPVAIMRSMKKEPVLFAKTAVTFTLLVLLSGQWVIAEPSIRDEPLRPATSRETVKLLETNSPQENAGLSEKDGLPEKGRPRPKVKYFGSVEQQPQVTLKGRTFTVEIADTPAARGRGLMYRNSLAEDRGMLFIYDDDALRSFWMKNTLISLDILYFDSDLQLINVIRGAQPCRYQPCPGYPSKAPARYVLELQSGMAETLAVKPGDRLFWPVK